MTKSKDYRLYTPGTDCYIRGIIREAKIIDAPYKKVLDEITERKNITRYIVDFGDGCSIEVSGSDIVPIEDLEMLKQYRV